jgi:streptogramin lyase
VKTLDLSRVARRRRNAWVGSYNVKALAVVGAIAGVFAGLATASEGTGFEPVSVGRAFLGLLVIAGSWAVVWALFRLARALRAGRRWAAAVVLTIFVGAVAGTFVPLAAFGGEPFAVIMFPLFAAFFLAGLPLAAAAILLQHRDEQRSRLPLLPPGMSTWEVTGERRPFGRPTLRAVLGSAAALVLVLLAIPAAVGLGAALGIESPGFIAFAAIAAATALFRFARRFAGESVSTVRQDDPRPPVLYLRSFHGDRALVQSRPGLNRGIMGADRRLMLPLEEIAAEHLWRFGPVIAAAEPGSQLPPLGAAREHIPHDRWQETVGTWMAEAPLIVVSLGRTEGLVWELQQLGRLGVLDRAVFLLSPEGREEVAARWELLRAVSEHIPELIVPAQIDFERTLAVVPRPGSDATVIVSRRANDVDFEAALDAAAALTFAERRVVTWAPSGEGIALDVEAEPLPDDPAAAAWRVSVVNFGYQQLGDVSVAGSDGTVPQPPFTLEPGEGATLVWRGPVAEDAEVSVAATTHAGERLERRDTPYGTVRRTPEAELADPPRLRRRALAAGLAVLAVGIGIAALVITSAGEDPTAEARLLAGGDRIWVVGGAWAPEAGSAMKPLDRASGRPLGEATDLGDYGYGLVAGEGALWGVGSSSEELVRLDPRSGAPTERVKLRGCPCSVHVGDGAVWLHSRAGIVKLDPKRLAPAASLRLRNVAPDGITAGDGTLWIDTYDGLRAYDSRTLRPRGAATAAPFDEMAVGAGALWLADNSAVQKLDPRTRRAETTVDLDPIGRRFRGIAASSSAVWVAFGADEDEVLRLDPVTGRRVGDPLDVGGEPLDVVADEHGAWVVVDSGRKVVRIDAASGEPGDPVSIE